MDTKNIIIFAVVLFILLIGAYFVTFYWYNYGFKKLFGSQNSAQGIRKRRYKK